MLTLYPAAAANSAVEKHDASSKAAKRKAASEITTNTDASPPFDLDPAMLTFYPPAAAHPVVGQHVAVCRDSQRKAATRASRFVDVAAKTAQPNRATSNSKAATSEDDDVEVDDDDKSDVSGLIDSGPVERGRGGRNPRELLYLKGVLFTSADVF